MKLLQGRMTYRGDAHPHPRITPSLLANYVGNFKGFAMWHATGKIIHVPVRHQTGMHFCI
ncbi:hypothetical protein SCEN_H00910 [Saccharomyces cerevisiae]|uniref:Uncharacterized protein YHR032W-A n=2 Tax=Saccharomyces cerevisiae TaxID=4932 RepID=YH32A_YEAST|nr:RecName: Full=Uncharacterized protein YHR032W-A [Saccharomyces cerevisiae S288C]EWG85675.1 hypothetical protein R008_H11696 [Saccharomyces cerevisiae R008]EWG90614.1 hypothetical protein P301_H10566 [Saccharomyces cerevisiae P301]EWG95651.1 hypothetical protein R103_H30361 [Saccharomyces cerevisiae R103]QHB09021.1 hypothetical protein SCEN_H00910 [Saccharomyces cerevisiae]WNM96948.1 hypothetical protein RMP76_087 [Saccharomyces cerevisiae synthetic construct]CAY80318.1 EC1118_1H23_0045p [S